MSITGSLIVFISIWWIVFFSVLPIGIKSQDKSFTTSLKGGDLGAPINPNIIKKFLITTLITTVLFFLIYFLVDKGYFNLRELLK